MTGDQAASDGRRQGRPRLTSASRLAGRFVWRAAHREFLISLVAEVVAAVALAGVLLFGRSLVLRLTDGSAVESFLDVLPVTLGLGLSLLMSGLAAVVVRQSRYLVAEQVTRHVQEEIVAVTTSVDYESYERQSFHDALNRANGRASEQSYQLVYDVLNLFSVAATSVVVTGVLVTTVPEVLGVMVLIAVPAVLAARASARLAFQAAYALTPEDRLRSSLYGALVGRAHARELRVFSLATTLRQRWSRLYDRRLARLREVVRRQMLYTGLAAAIGAALVAAVLLLLVNAAVSGRITLADAAVAIVALQQLTNRVRAASGAAGSLRQATLFLDDFDAFRRLRQPRLAPSTTPEAGPLADPEGAAGDEGSTAAGVTTPAPTTVEPLPRAELVVDGLSFRYPGTEQVVLDDVSLRIGPGEIVALVGVSGSGKTTLAHLISGLYRPTAGRITYGGTDVRDLPQATYWRSLATVFQDFVRYELTARENIALGDDQRLMDVDAVREAASRAGIADALERLPDGYETMMSRAYDRGADLSVGQWQRVAVARAFFREAPLLILDEPAAALDAVAEQRLHERLVELCADRSVLLISHRFSTVRLADRICVVHEGRIVEQGTHGELLALGGRYAELFRLQASGFLDHLEAPVPLDGSAP